MQLVFDDERKMFVNKEDAIDNFEPSIRMNQREIEKL